MPVPPLRRLPERPSLEQLRKQAKEHLDTLRAADPSATLSAAQHALAREYGFDSWPALVHHVEALQPQRRMLQPAELKSDQRLTWSSGRGTDVWALFQACASGDLQTVQALIAKDRSLARAHYDYRKPLYFAVRENRVDVARFLLEHDSNPLDLWVDDNPLEIARDRGYAAMERMLAETLEATFNASAKGETVALALRNHDLKKMRQLLDAQPELVGKGDARSNQPIHWATMTRQIEAIDELLRRGADINARRMDGARPIHLTNGDYFYRGWRDVPRFWPVTSGAGHGASQGARRDHRSADRVSYRRHRARPRAAPAGSVPGEHARRTRRLLPRRRRATLERRGRRPHGHRPAAARARRRSESARRAVRAEGEGAVFGGVPRTLRDREAAARARRVSESAGGEFGQRALGFAGMAPGQAHGTAAVVVRRRAGTGAAERGLVRRASTTGCASRRSTRRPATAT